MFDNSKESISVFILFFLQVCAFIFIYIYIYIYIYVYMYICICIYIYIYVYVYICICDFNIWKMTSAKPEVFMSPQEIPRIYTVGLVI